MPVKPKKTKDGKLDKIFKLAKKRLKEVGKVSADTPAPIQASVQSEGGAQVVPHIVLHSTSSSKDESRKIAIVGGMPMYCSTGNNSKAADTWFPFVGQKPNDGYPGKGWIIKPEFVTSALKDELGSNSQLKASFDKFMQNINQNDGIYLEQDFANRWGSVSGLLLSANIGGGIWETTAGKAFKLDIQEQYAAFFDNMPPFQITGEPDKTIVQNKDSDNYASSITEVNKFVGFSWSSDCDENFEAMKNAYATSAAALALARTPQEIMQGYADPARTLNQDMLNRSMKSANNIDQKSIWQQQAFPQQGEAFGKQAFPQQREAFGKQPSFPQQEAAFGKQPFPPQSKQTGWDTPKTTQSEFPQQGPAFGKGGGARQTAGFSKQFPTQGQPINPEHKAPQPAYRAPSPPADKKRKGSKPR